jgi:predicted enzyme related to lactoylglutathione lyase
MIALYGMSDKKATAQAQGTELEIRTHGVKINVDDMDRAIAFYVDKLGFEIESRQDYPREVFLKTGERIKLSLRAVKNLQKPEPQETRVSFTLQVNDLDQAIARMKSRGVEFAESEKRKEGVGFAISIRDPFGARISLMHQTIVKVEPFKEPKIYNFGFYIPEMEAARSFYTEKLNFLVRSERYLPLDLPLGHKDKTFAFMLHYRPGAQAVKSSYPALPWQTVVFETTELHLAAMELKKRGVKILSKNPEKSSEGYSIAFEDPFGNVSELLEVARPSNASPQAAINDFAWLSGCWDHEQGNRQRDENWSKPAGGTMLGTGRAVVGGKTTEYEFMRIHQEADGIYFTAKPSGQPEASFKLVSLSGKRAVFENPKHDFPQRVIYSQNPDGSLVARIEGERNGQPRGIDFPFKRAKCD